MKWEKMSEDTARKLEELVQPFACQKKPMFGYDVYRVNGNMFTGIFQSSIFFRLSQSDRKEFVGKYEDARLFEPMEGRTMKDYVVVPEKKAKSKKVKK